MKNIKILKNEGNGTELRVARRIKTLGGDYAKLVSYRITTKPVVDEEPVIEPVQPTLQVKPVVDVKPVVEEPVVEEPVVVPEFKPEYKEPVSFAYEAHVEEEIAPDTIKEITGKLEESYKGVNPVVTKKVEEQKVEKKIETPVTKEEFERVLKIESYIEKIGIYKNGIKKAYDKILADIAAKQLELDGIRTEYKNETEVIANLQEDKKKAQNVLTGVNGINLDFLEGENDQLVRNFFESLKMLYNDRRGKFYDYTQAIKNSDEIKRALGQDETRVCEELKQQKEGLIEYMNKKYPIILDANKMDVENRALDNRITEITGIEDEQTGIEDEQKEEKKSILSIENVVEGNFNTVNPFAGLYKEKEDAFKKVA